MAGSNPAPASRDNEDPHFVQALIRSNRARVTLWFHALRGLAPASVAHQNTEPDRAISLSRLFGRVQISLVGSFTTFDLDPLFRVRPKPRGARKFGAGCGPRSGDL